MEGCEAMQFKRVQLYEKVWQMILSNSYAEADKCGHFISNKTNTFKRKHKKESRPNVGNSYLSKRRDEYPARLRLKIQAYNYKTCNW